MQARRERLKKYGRETVQGMRVSLLDQMVEKATITVLYSVV